MLRSASTLFLALLLFAISLPARAENWVLSNPINTWIWIDLDSVSRSGSLVTFTTALGNSAGVSPSVGGAESTFRLGIDCEARQRYYSDANGNLVAAGLATDSDEYYPRFCQSAPRTPPPAAPAPAASPLLTSWRIDDMTNSVRRQGGTTDGVRLSHELRVDAQTTHTNLPYLIAATSAGRRFKAMGHACTDDRSSCHGAYFIAEYQFASAEQA